MVSRLIVGCGYVGKQVAQRWLNEGDSVFAITRSNSRANELSQFGIKPIVWDWLAGEGLSSENNDLDTFSGLNRPKFATILVAVSHSPQPGLAHVETHVRGLNHLANLLKTMGWDDPQTQTKWVYLSTTGVFGPSSPGDWVDEDSPVCPVRPGSIAALAGEQWMASHISLSQQVILRPAGIYGPDRAPRWKSIRDKIPLQVDPESYLNLIHVDDLAATVVAVSSASMQFSLYCVSDGEPVRRKEYYETISELGNWPRPVFETPSPEESRRLGSRSDGNKRVNNNRIQAELAIRFEYPSYREGLKSLALCE